MKLEKYALIADIIAGVAVVATLIVLIFNIQENTETMRATAAAASRESLADISDLMLELDHDLFELIVRSGDPSSIREDFINSEFFRLVALQRALFRRAEAQYFRYRNGMLDEDAWRTVVHRVWFNISIPVQQEIWNLEKVNVYTPGFIRAVESYRPPDNLNN